MQPHLLRPITPEAPGWRLSSDGDGFALERGRIAEKGKAAGEEVWEKRGYHGRITDALKASISRLTATSDQEMHKAVADTLYSISQALRAISEEVEGRAIKLTVTL